MSKATSPKKQPVNPQVDQDDLPIKQPDETTTQEQQGEEDDTGGGIEVPKKPPPPINEP